MKVKRIVSFLPSATELLYELRVEDNLYGVTHECKYPEEASLKPQVINSVIKSDELDSNEIDVITCKLLNEGKNIFVIQENNLKNADPDLIIAQETCEVCAAYTSQVNEAVKILGKKPIIHYMNPRNMKEIIESVIELGKILDKNEMANEIAESLEKRIKYIKDNVNNEMPKVLAIEWLEPFFTAGHWIPEMIEIAGGINLISKTGEQSRRLEIDEIIESKPDIVILMPCGFDINRTVSEYKKNLKRNKMWESLDAVKNGRVFAVDANSFFSKPSIRTVEGLEILAKIIQPENFVKLKILDKSFVKIGNDLE